MTDPSPEELIAQGMVWFRQHRADYIRTKGGIGHIVDLTHDGGYPFATHCLLRTIGRKSGKAYINPLFYAVWAGEIAVIGSAAGSKQDPNWSKNLRAAKEAQVQIAGQAFRVTWRLAEGDERQKIWDYVVTNHPSFKDYQTRTMRQIPVILLRPVEEISVFTEADYD